MRPWCVPLGPAMGLLSSGLTICSAIHGPEQINADDDDDDDDNWNTLNTNLGY